MNQPSPSTPERVPTPDSLPAQENVGDHFDKWVAFQFETGRIIGANPDLEALMHELNQTRGELSDVHVKYVSDPHDHHFDMGGES